MLFHRRLAVFYIRHSLSSIVGCDPRLPVLFDGGDRNLCSKLLRELLCVHLCSPKPKMALANNLRHDCAFFAACFRAREKARRYGWVRISVAGKFDTDLASS